MVAFKVVTFETTGLRNDMVSFQAGFRNEMAAFETGLRVKALKSAGPYLVYRHLSAPLLHTFLSWITDTAPL